MMKVTVETITIEMERRERLWARLLVQGYSKLDLFVIYLNYVRTSQKLKEKGSPNFKKFCPPIVFQSQLLH
jgi:hypothetical protein